MQNPQVAAPTLAGPPATDTATDTGPGAGPGAAYSAVHICVGPGARDRTGRLAHGVRQGFKIIGRRARGFGDLQPHDVPAKGGREASGVPGAQVVAVWLGVGRQRAEDGRRLGVDIGEGRHGGLAARGAATAAKRTHEREPSRQPA